MPRIKLPYGRSQLIANIPDSRLKGVLLSKADDYVPAGTETEIVRQAVASPLASPTLKELARGCKNAVIISSDHTRPVPSRIIMPEVLSELRRGNPGLDITILVATGAHRTPTEAELYEKYGEEIVSDERIVLHNSRDAASMTKIGTLPSGGELILNKLAVETDLLVAEGFIEPHFFAGFSGGRKSVLPGIASYKTVLANHCSEFIDSDKSRTGILEGNPIHIDMLYAAGKANLRFIVNVVIDSDKKVINAFAGHFEKAHLAGCKFVRGLAGVTAQSADIVITTNGGYPLDQNIYQAVKGMTAAEATCKKGGVIIIAAECEDGHGGADFYETFAKTDSVQGIMEGILARGRNETQPDQWEAQILARILLKHNVIMVTDLPREMIESMHMHWAPGIEEAIEMAEKILGNRNSGITVIPDGISVIVE